MYRGSDFGDEDSFPQLGSGVRHSVSLKRSLNRMVDDFYSKKKSSKKSVSTNCIEVGKTRKLTAQGSKKASGRRHEHRKGDV